MSEFKNGFLFTTELYLRADWWIHQLHCRLKAVHVLSLLGSNSANFPCSELQFCETPVLLLNELYSFTSASPVSDCFFSVSLFSA